MCTRVFILSSEPSTALFTAGVRGVSGPTRTGASTTSRHDGGRGPDEAPGRYLLTHLLIYLLTLTHLLRTARLKGRRDRRPPRGDRPPASTSRGSRPKPRGPDGPAGLHASSGRGSRGRALPCAVRREGLDRPNSRITYLPRLRPSPTLVIPPAAHRACAAQR